jgi:hypothetical protein
MNDVYDIDVLLLYASRAVRGAPATVAQVIQSDALVFLSNCSCALSAFVKIVCTHAFLSSKVRYIFLLRFFQNLPAAFK